MHESITIAEVGDIVNVSGRRIATPLAPPRPGSTPISTPRTMPKPCINEFSSTIRGVLRRSGRSARRRPAAERAGSVAQEIQRPKRALVERHLEPDLEHQEEQ